MVVDTEGNTIIKKDFWADGSWHVAFILIPLFIGWLALLSLLLYGAYFTFSYDAIHIKAGALFAVFALLAIIGIIPFAKSIWSLLTEKIIFTGGNFVYRGFGSYSVAYKSIKRFSLNERMGPFGKEKLLALYARDEFDRERIFVIPRWKTLSGGVLGQEFSKRMPLSLLDRGMLSYYAAYPGREWLLAVILLSMAVAGISLFLVARAYPENAAGITVVFWMLFSVALIIVLVRYIGKKKYIIPET